MDDEPLIPRVYIALLALVFLSAFVGTKASAKEIPKIPTITKTATAIPSLISSPTPTASPAPTSTPTQAPTPTATLTLPEIYASEAVEVTANIVVNRCLFYVNTTLGWLEREDSNYHILTADDLPLMLAVFANESACDPSVVSSAGAIGIGQVIPKPFYGACLHQTPCNIYWSNWIMDRAIGIAKNKGLPLEYGIGFYNCSEEGVMNDGCGNRGGLNYSERVLRFWLPLFVEELGVEYDLGKFD